MIAPDGETTYSYDSVGNRQKVTYANGISTQYGYDPLNRLISLETRKPDNSLLASYQYTLAPTGHRTQITDHTGRVVDYRYDELYRLKEEAITQADGSELSFSYQYDAVGNRVYSIEDGIHTKYAYDTNDRILKQGGVKYEYDKNGNTTRLTEENRVVYYNYDGNDRLIKVITEENGQLSSTVTYAYDADGNRIQTNADGEITQYVVDRNDSLTQVIAELDSNNQVKVAYLHGDDLVSQYRGNEVNYYHYDGLGSIRMLTDSHGANTDSYDYEAFGVLLTQTGNTENNYLYTGEQIDPNTGNYYLRARYYNPASGRFLSMDSFGGLSQNPMTLHKYLYANADPVKMIDPTGHFSLGSFGTSNTIRGILITMKGGERLLDILDFATDPTGAIADKLTDKAFGAIVILGRLSKGVASKWLHLFSKKAGKGKEKGKGGCPLKRKKNSFTAETLVQTQKGLVAISEVKIGDMVWSYNENTDQPELNEVIHLIQGQQEYDLISLILDSGETIETTADHPFYLRGKGWNPANTLKVGQALVLRNGTVVVIKEILTEARLESVYNLMVSKTHNYFVGQDGILVQNCEPDEV
jgi:RHS repeat-associated protein